MVATPVSHADYPLRYHRHGVGGRNQGFLSCDETEMKPFSGLHEAVVKPPAVKELGEDR